MMLFRRPLRFIFNACLWAGLSIGSLAVPLSAQTEIGGIFWPTPDGSFLEGGPIEPLLQPTASGILESALFGCVRNGGRRFHEGLDIRPLRRDRRGEATDPVYAMLAGRVAYVNTVAGNSSYGRYVVIEHDGEDVPVHTLYAHLARVTTGLSAGSQVKAGQEIGVMGRSAGGYSIPRERAHLHLEIGFRKSDNFQSWYDWKRFGSANQHGTHNGMNLIGMDPLHFYETVRAGHFQGFASYVRSLPTAFTLRVATREVPDFIRRYAGLLSRPIPVEGVYGWDIDYTWYGLPKQWTPLTQNDVRTRTSGDVTLVDYDRSVFEGKCRGTLVFGPGDAVTLGNRLQDDLRLIFGFR